MKIYAISVLLLLLYPSQVCAEAADQLSYEGVIELKLMERGGKSPVKYQGLVFYSPTKPVKGVNGLVINRRQKWRDDIGWSADELWDLALYQIRDDQSICAFGHKITTKQLSEGIADIPLFNELHLGISELTLPIEAQLNRLATIKAVDGFQLIQYTEESNRYRTALTAQGTIDNYLTVAFNVKTLKCQYVEKDIKQLVALFDFDYVSTSADDTTITTLPDANNIATDAQQDAESFQSTEQTSVPVGEDSEVPYLPNTAEPNITQESFNQDPLIKLDENLPGIDLTQSESASENQPRFVTIDYLLMLAVLGVVMGLIYNLFFRKSPQEDIENNLLSSDFAGAPDFKSEDGTIKNSNNKEIENEGNEQSDNQQIDKQQQTDITPLDDSHDHAVIAALVEKIKQLENDNRCLTEQLSDMTEQEMLREKPSTEESPPELSSTESPIADDSLLLRQLFDLLGYLHDDNLQQVAHLVLQDLKTRPELVVYALQIRRLLDTLKNKDCITIVKLIDLNEVAVTLAQSVCVEFYKHGLTLDALKIEWRVHLQYIFRAKLLLDTYWDKEYPSLRRVLKDTIWAVENLAHKRGMAPHKPKLLDKAVLIESKIDYLPELPLADKLKFSAQFMAKVKPLAEQKLVFCDLAAWGYDVLDDKKRLVVGEPTQLIGQSPSSKWR